MKRIAIIFLVIVAPLLGLLLVYLGWMSLKTNLLGWFILVSGLVYTLGVVVVYGIQRRAFWRPLEGNSIQAEEKADRSFWFIIPGMVTSFFVPPLEYLYLSHWMLRAQIFQTIGLTLVVIGGLLFIWAKHLLKEAYSGHLAVTEKQELVKHGPYRVIRHPAYLSFLLIALGNCLGFSSLIGLFCMPVLLIPGIVYRIHVEEKLLSEYFKDAYQQYALKSYRLIPGIW